MRVTETSCRCRKLAGTSEKRAAIQGCYWGEFCRVVANPARPFLRQLVKSERRVQLLRWVLNRYPPNDGQSGTMVAR